PPRPARSARGLHDALPIFLGMGRIGQAVARRANVFGMQVHYHNRRRLRQEIEDDLQATYWESLDQMLARMDIVSVNAPHTPSTLDRKSTRLNSSHVKISYA